MQRIYTTLAGNEVKFDEPSPEIAAFIARAQTLLDSKKATEEEMITLVYGPDNPILSRHPLFPERGYVTKEALAHPVYLVLADMVVRKHAQRERVDVSQLGDRYTLTIAEAAKRRNVSDTTIRKAISAGRLSTFRRNGSYFLEPGSVDALVIGERGSAPSEPLDIVAGTGTKLFLHVRTPVHNEPLGAGTDAFPFVLKTWRRVGVLTANAGGLRLFVIEPGDAADEIKLGRFHVEGHFKIVEKVNNSAAARKAWKDFRAV